MRGFVIKEFYHIFRDFRTVLILLGMPVAQILLFGFAITKDIKDANIAILDHSRDVTTRKITNKLVSSDYFILDRYLESEAQIEDAFRSGEIKMAVVFGSNFDEKLQKMQGAPVQVIADASDPNLAGLLVNYTLSILNDYQLELMTFSPPAGIVEVESKMLYNAQLESVYMFVPGIITILLMLICAMMTSISIAREKETGTMEVLLVSPLKPYEIIVGKLIPYVIISLMIAGIITGMGYFIFGVPVRGNLLMLLAEVLLFILMALSLGILISTVSPTQQIALMISLAGLMLPTILLSGFIFPVENMPLALQYLSHLMPPKWFIIIIKNILLKGVGFSFFWKETLIIAGMTLVFVLLSVKNFKKRLE